MTNPKKLKRRHKKFLSGQGLKPQDFLIITENVTTYRFYNRETNQIVDYPK